jgi:adenylate cyclase
MLAPDEPVMLPQPILIRGGLQQKLRLVSGLVLFAFAATHFLNTALGVVSIQTMLYVEQFRTAITRSTLGTVVLSLALATHILLALAKLVGRSTLRMPAWELVQIITGLTIPLLLFPHIIGTHVAYVRFGIEDNYTSVLGRLWPEKAWTQSVLLLLVWMHGCIGLHYWLRLSRAYRRFVPILVGFAVIVPFAGLVGFMVAGRSVEAAMAVPNAVTMRATQSHRPDALMLAALSALEDYVRLGFAALVGIVPLFHFGRFIRRSAMPKVKIHYAGGPTVFVPQGPTLLEISRINGVPHTSVCGGRARCSTCRVLVVSGAGTLPPPLGAEASTLASIRASPGVRLACQIRPTAPLTVVRLVEPAINARVRAKIATSEIAAVERALAVLFLDVRAFTQLCESKLPHDVVFVLNRFFNMAGEAIEAGGGTIGTYLGDGLMAIFGHTTGPEAGCREALMSARAIDLALDTFNAELAPEIGRPLSIGMGLHVGPLVVGHIGYAASASNTVIGTTVNISSRLEQLTKAKRCQLIVSCEVLERAGIASSRYRREHVIIRGLTAPLEIAEFERARDIPRSIASASRSDGGAHELEPAAAPP